MPILTPPVTSSLRQVRQLADQAITSTASSPDLTLTVAASSVYTVRAVLHIIASSGATDVSLLLPASASTVMAGTGKAGGGSTTTIALITNGSYGALTGNSGVGSVLVLDGTVVTGASAGSVTVSFGPSVSGTHTLKAGSFMSLTLI
jgi:hypothetical protein